MNDTIYREMRVLVYVALGKTAYSNVFLERCYKNGFSGKKAAMIYRKLYDLAKRKAELLGAGLVLADDYKTVAELNGLAKKCSYIYVSESKNGKQYLDSLGGNCESGGYYVRGNFFFAS